MFSRLFGTKKQTLPPEIERIFEKVRNFLENEAVQNAAMPVEFRLRMEAGEATDEISGAAGEFGRTPKNPIPVNGPVGEVVYLSLLRTLQGHAIFFHRLGSVQGDVDVYEVLSGDLSVREELYLHMYHPRRSRRPPRGYQMAKSLNVRNYIYGTNANVPTFPQGLDFAVRDCQKALFGMPFVMDEVREFVRRASQ